LRTKALALLSGEGTTIPAAEARALFETYDPTSVFEVPEERILIAETDADTRLVSSRVAFSRRVGLLLDGREDVARMVEGKRIRFRSFSLPGADSSREPDPGLFLRGINATVDLDTPELEISLVRGRRTYLLASYPTQMNQGWAKRRPRRRPFFHPSAIFPKLSRALVNLSRCREGEVILDPFAGTGSILIEASCIGLTAVGLDRSTKMSRGAMSNMRGFDQSWMGVVMADAFSAPVRTVQGIVTDVPYGRASSALGRAASDVVRTSLEKLPDLVPPGRRIVIMHPKTEVVAGTERLSVEENHHLYMHRNLTRTITVLRRR